MYSHPKSILEDKNQKIVRISAHNCAGKGLGRNGICYHADFEVTENGRRSCGYQISRETFNKLAKEGYPVNIGWAWGEGKNPNSIIFHGKSEDDFCKQYLGSYVHKHWKAETLNNYVAS